MKKIVFALLVIVLFAACSAVAPAPTPTPTCVEQAATYVEEVDALIQRWDDASAVAGSTARISLAGPVGSLQEIRREAEVIEHPPCADLAHQRMVLYMQQVIDSYLAFMAGEDDAAVNRQFSTATETLASWSEAYAELQPE